MSRREDFDNALWSDPDFLALSSEARMTYIWSWTNPRCGMAGIYKVAPAQAALETGYSVEQVQAALAELGEAEFAFYEAHVLFVRTRARRLRTKSEQIAKSIRSDLQRIADDHPLKAKFLATYGDLPWLRPWISGSRASVEADSSEVPSSPPSKPFQSKSKRESPGSRSTPKDNGNGSGNGKGPLGRGAGEGPSDAFLAEQFPEHPAGLVAFHASYLRRHKQEVTPDAIRVLLDREQAA